MKIRFFLVVFTLIMIIGACVKSKQVPSVTTYLMVDGRGKFRMRGSSGKSLKGGVFFAVDKRGDMRIDFYSTFLGITVASLVVRDEEFTFFSHYSNIAYEGSIDDIGSIPAGEIIKIFPAIFFGNRNKLCSEEILCKYGDDNLLKEISIPGEMDVRITYLNERRRIRIFFTGKKGNGEIELFDFKFRPTISGDFFYLEIPDDVIIKKMGE